MRRYGLELLVAPDLSGRAEQVWREAQIEDLVWTVDTRLACGAWHLPIPGPDVGWAASAVDPHASALREAGNADPDASSLAHALRPDAASGRAGRRGQRVRGRWLHADRRWPAITLERLGERRASGRRGSDGPGRRVAAGAIVATPRWRGRGGRGPACAHRSCHDHLSGRRTRIAPRAHARMAELQLHPADVRRKGAGRPGRRVPCAADWPAIVPDHARAVHAVLRVSVGTGVAGAAACLGRPDPLGAHLLRVLDCCQEDVDRRELTGLAWIAERGIRAELRAARRPFR